LSDFAVQWRIVTMTHRGRDARLFASNFEKEKLRSSHLFVWFQQHKPTSHEGGSNQAIYRLSQEEEKK